MFRLENNDGEFLSSIKLVGTDGAITGPNVDVCIIDDYIKGFDDCTHTKLNKLYDWLHGVLIQPLEPHSKLLILANRWASYDIIGRLKEYELDKYRFIELKALNKDGICMWPNRYTP